MTVFDSTGPLAWTPMSTRKQKKGADPSQFDFLVNLFFVFLKHCAVVVGAEGGAEEHQGSLEVFAA